MMLCHTSRNELYASTEKRTERNLEALMGEGGTPIRESGQFPKIRGDIRSLNSLRLLECCHIKPDSGELQNSD